MTIHIFIETWMNNPNSKEKHNNNSLHSLSGVNSFINPHLKVIEVGETTWVLTL